MNGIYKTRKFIGVVKIKLYVENHTFSPALVCVLGG